MVKSQAEKMVWAAATCRGSIASVTMTGGRSAQLERSGRVQVLVANPEAHAFDDEVLLYAEELAKHDLVTVRHRPDYFRFVVESTGALDAALVVVQALDVLINKAAQVAATRPNMAARGDDDERGA